MTCFALCFAAEKWYNRQALPPLFPGHGASYEPKRRSIHSFHLIRNRAFPLFAIQREPVFQYAKEESTMPMDGVMLGFVARELDSVLRDGRVEPL